MQFSMMPQVLITKFTIRFDLLLYERSERSLIVHLTRFTLRLAVKLTRPASGIEVSHLNCGSIQANDKKKHNQINLDKQKQ